MNPKFTYYALDAERQPFPVADLSQWAIHRSQGKWRVAITKMGQHYISTLFLGIDNRASPSPDTPPLLFETCVFDENATTIFARCPTWAAAELQHRLACALVRARLKRKEPAMPTEVIDIGDQVCCDVCNTDFTNAPASEETGGFLFSSYGICPRCAADYEAEARKCGEESFIRERAREGETFKAFCLRLRGGDNTVTIRSGEDAEKALGLKS